MYKESEKVRKSYSKNEISVEDFIKNYMEMRTQFHEIEHKKYFLMHQHQPK